MHFKRWVQFRLYLKFIRWPHSSTPPEKGCHDETYSQLIDAGVTPTVVVAFRGGASLYVTRGAKYVDTEDAGTKKEIQGWIDQFSQHGFRIEQCAIAAKAQKVDPADFLPTVNMVQNGYIYIVANQARGYALLPMD